MDMGLGELWELVMGLACCGSWGLKESDTTEQQNRTELKGMSHARTGTIKDRNSKDLTEGGPNNTREDSTHAHH